MASRKGIKLVGTIVDTKHNLIGFRLEGKDKDFGGFQNVIVTRNVPLPNLIREGFINSQIKVTKNSIAELGNFKINSLPMHVFTGSSYVDVDNSISLVGRFVKENENIGFRVQFSDGSQDNVTYINVLKLSRWFKPSNFSIRTSSNGKEYICGKPGSIKLDELPATTLGEESKAKKTKSAAKSKEQAMSAEMTAGVDIIDIYNFIGDCNGYIINLPNEKYVAATENGETTVEGFTSLGIGEVADPKPLFTATKINVNAQFKKVGIVQVNINGTETNIPTFIYREKSIFLKGDNYIKKFGIAVPVEKEAELIKGLSTSLALEKVENPTLIQPLSQVLNVKALAFYLVDSSKIDLLSQDKRKSSILTANQLATLCKKQYELKLVSKALGPMGGLMKTLKAELGPNSVAQALNKKPSGLFSMMSEDAINKITEAGIDIYTGAYTVPGKPYSSKKSGGKDDEEKEIPVEIEYTLKGYDISKVTGGKILQAVKDNNTKVVTESVIKQINAVLSISNPQKQYAEANKLYKAAEAKYAELNKKLWLHNASMYLLGNKERVHTNDAKNWVLDETSRVKAGEVYKSLKVEGLTVKLKGISI